MTKARLIVGVIVLGILLAGSLFIYSYIDSVPLTITSTHLAKLEVRRDTSTLATATGDMPSTTVRVPKYSTIQLVYTGSNGYAGGVKTVTVGDKPFNQSITPYFAKQRLAEMLKDEQPSINTVITNYNESIENNYSIKNTALYHFGDWASAQLVWRGEYDQNTDTLSVILQKKDDTWRLVGRPSITFFSGDYPEVPLDILRSVNQP